MIWFCIHTHSHTPWQNAQAALNHNTFYWSRLNSHKASLKKEIGQIRKRFSWKKVQRENTDRAWKCAMEMDVHLPWSSVRSLLHGLLLILCSYNIYQSLCCLLCHTRHLNHCFFSFHLTLSLCHFATAANILLAQAAGCWYWSIWCWDRSSSKLGPPIHLRAIKCD